MIDEKTKEILRGIRFWLLLILLNLTIANLGTTIANLGIQSKLTEINESIQEQTACDEVLLERE